MGLKHSDIVKKLLRLQNINFKESTKDIRGLLDLTTNLTAGVSYLDADRLNTIIASLSASLIEYEEAISSFNVRLRTVLNDSEKDYIRTSEEIWQQNLEKMTFQEHMMWSKLWPPNFSDLDRFSEYCCTFSTWNLPGLIVGAKVKTEILETIFGTDPTYVVEKYKQYLDIHKNTLTPEQMKKLRFYTLDELSLLPKNSIGVIVVFNEFNFLPWTITQSMMHLLSRCLTPGGIIIFTFNDCTTYSGFVQFEKRLMSYTTPQMFKDLGKHLGLEFVKLYNSSSQAFSFMSLQKPGERRAIKKHVALGYINQHIDLKDPTTHQRRIEHIRNLVSSKYKL